MTSAMLHNDILTITIPVGFKRKSARKMIVTPDGKELFPQLIKKKDPDPYFAEALKRVFVWQEKLDEGIYKNAKEMAEKESVDLSYMYRTMRLVLLAPDIIESLINGTQPPTLTLENIVRGFPIIWREQRELFGFPEPVS